MGPDQAEHTDTGPRLPRRRGLARAVRRAAARGRRQADRPDRVRRRDPGRRRHPRRPAGRDGVQLVSEPGDAADPRRRLRLPVLRQRGPHRRDLRRRRGAAAPQDRGGRVDPGAAVARRDQLRRPGRHPRVLRAAPGLRALGHPHAPAHGRDDVVPADQRLAPQPGHRPRPAPVAAPRVLRDARHRRVHARHRPAAAGRRGEDLGPGPAHGRQQHLHLLPRPARQHRRVHDRAGAARRGHLAPAPVRLHRARGLRPVGHREPDERVRRRRSRSTTRTRACSSPRRSDALRDLGRPAATSRPAWSRTHGLHALPPTTHGARPRPRRAAGRARGGRRGARRPGRAAGRACGCCRRCSRRPSATSSRSRSTSRAW